MRLSTKFTLWYFGIMLVVLLIGGGIVYYRDPAETHAGGSGAA